VVPVFVELSPVAVQTILAGCYLDEDFFRRWWNLLTPDFWGDAYYNRIAKFLKNYVDQYGQRPDFMLMVDFFASDPSLSAEEREVYASIFDDLLTAPLAHLSFYADHLRTYIRRQAFSRAIVEAEKHLERHNFDGIVSDITTASLIATERNFGTADFFSLPEIDKRCDERVTPTVFTKRLPLAIGNLDHYIRGGIASRTLTLFVGPSNSGKSFALVHAGREAILRGYKVLHVTLEMEPDSIIERFDSCFSGIQTNLLNEQAGKVRAKMQKDFAKYGDSLRIIGYPENTLTPDDLSALLTSLKRDVKFVPDVVLVDYADLMKAQDRRYEAHRFELSSVYTNLHKIAKQHNIILVTATQSNRHGMKSRVVNMYDVSEDISKVNISDYVFTICQTPEESQKNVSRVFIAKNRSGARHLEIRFYQDLSKAMFALPSLYTSRIVPASELMSGVGPIEEIISLEEPEKPESAGSEKEAVT